MYGSRNNVATRRTVAPDRWSLQSTAAVLAARRAIGRSWKRPCKESRHQAQLSTIKRSRQNPLVIVRLRSRGFIVVSRRFDAILYTLQVTTQHRHSNRHDR